ncbi:MAG TPA: ECF-type sigma factor [Gemmatales bacterium]|nr:ECF-type sigma factor [Gemmatales bacterium]
MISALSSHGRVRAAELHELYSARLLGILRSNNPKVDPAYLSDAVIDAIMSLASNGVQEDVTKGKLLTLLKKIAQRRVIDRLRKQQRRRQRELDETACSVTNLESVSKVSGQQMIDRELAVRYVPQLVKDEDERKYLQFWMEGYSDEEITDKFGVSSENREQVAKLVIQISQRLRQRLSRLRKQLAREDQP